MIEHHLQKQIIATLVEAETARYADLKPKNVDGNTFTYHLHSLQKQKFVIKNEDGLYELTNKGKLYGINSSLKKAELFEQAHSIILLSIRDGDRWLLRKRLVQPLYDKIGFIHGEPIAGETILEAAARTLSRRTNLEGTFTVKGSGYICMKHNEELVAYSHFTLLEVSELKGDLKEADSHGENLWLDKPDFSSSGMIPSMPELVAELAKPGIFFVDLAYTIG